MSVLLHLILLAAAAELRISLPRAKADAAFDPSRSRPLSWRPRAFVYDGFLSHEECDHLISLAKGKLEKPTVGDDDHGNNSLSKLRTVPAVFINVSQDGIISRIEQRIATWTLLPVENGKDMEILHYEHGQQYGPHFNYFQNKSDLQVGDQYIATVLMYLSDVQQGGESVFPNAEERKVQVKDDSWSGCAKKGHAVKPKKGDALLFFNLHLNLTTDSYSLHESCVVMEGDKWSATKRIHTKSFNNFEEKDSEECIDYDELCSHMAALGACKKNPQYMVGQNGICRKSCGDCLAQDDSGTML